MHWAGQAAHQLTVDLARRAHQSPGRLVDEDGLRGLPLAQRTGQGQSGVVAFVFVFLVWKIVRLQELFADKTVRANGVTHRYIDRYINSDSTYAYVHTYVRTVYHTSGEQGRELQFAASILIYPAEHSDRH